MFKQITVVVSIVAFAGCSQNPEPIFRTSRSGPITATRASAESFVALVAPSTATARCEDLRNLPAALGARGLSLIYGDPPDRRVTVILDADGAPKSYSDGRGDLVTSDDHEGDFTSISINFVQGHAFAVNRPASGELQRMRFTLDDALSSAVLDNPQILMDRVLSTCGGMF